MPVWLESILISMAVSLGKIGLEWLITKFPGIPASVVATVESVLNDIKPPSP